MSFSLVELGLGLFFAFAGLGLGLFLALWGIAKVTQAEKEVRKPEE